MDKAVVDYIEREVEKQDRASLKMSFLQTMLEIDGSHVSLMQEAFEEAMSEYIQLRG